MSKYSRNFFIAGVLSIAVCLSACGEKSSESDGTVSTVSVTEETFPETEAADSENVSPEIETEEPEQENPYEDLDNVSYYWVDNYDPDTTDLSFLAEHENITSLRLEGSRIDAEKLAAELQKTNIKELYITALEYSSDDSDLLMKAMPECKISYTVDFSYPQWRLPDSGLVFFTNVYIIPDTEEEPWECKTGPTEIYAGESWWHRSSLVCTFTNFYEESKKINSVQIFRDVNGILTEMHFADGSTALEIDFTIDSNTNSDFDITEEMFPFSKCETGIYKVVFDSDGEKLEQTFFIYHDGMTFLTDEQRKVFDAASEITGNRFGCSTYMPEEYIESHTTEDFLAELCEGYTYDYAYARASEWGYIDENGDLKVCFGDRGSSIIHIYDCYVPVFSDENQVIFKNISIQGHPDDPYSIGFMELNYHMVKTDDGWRFDLFQISY